MSERMTAPRPAHTDYADLIARLEAATEGSRELDAAIRFVVVGDMTRCNFDEGSYHGDCASPGCGGWLGLHDERKSYPSDWRDDERLPHYTTSLDAALSLVPDGWDEEVKRARHRRGWFVCLAKDDITVTADAPTAAQAMSAAALKARAKGAAHD